MALPHVQNHLGSHFCSQPNGETVPEAIQPFNEKGFNLFSAPSRPDIWYNKTSREGKIKQSWGLSRAEPWLCGEINTTRLGVFACHNFRVQQLSVKPPKSFNKLLGIPIWLSAPKTSKCNTEPRVLKHLASKLQNYLPEEHLFLDETVLSNAA